jgi:tRNA-uridine 2-sulfurtransferase
VIAARSTCHRLGIPHVTIDARKEFLRAIVEPFVRGYRRGETPNPCTRCNGFFRFGRLLQFARSAGAAGLATGHYARTVEHGGRLLLARGADADKDQSYMLARLDPRVLDRISFPLGGQSKEETREEAERAGLAAARRAESQEACFLGGGDYRTFLARHGVGAEEGVVEDEDGEVLGSHAGFWRFTPGQRKGLGVAAGSPVYALRTVPARNAVVVGPRESLARRRVRADGRLFADADRVDVKLRYRSPAVPGRVQARARGFEAVLDEPAYGVAPGQAAVLYDGDVVVGAGRVVSSRT